MSVDEGEDKREHERVEANFLVRSTMLGSADDLPGVDVSRGGLFVKTLRFLPLNAVVHLTIRLPEGEELPATCRVVFVRDLQEARRSGAPAGMGLELLDIADQHRPALERLIASGTPQPPSVRSGGGAKQHRGELPLPRPVASVGLRPRTSPPQGSEMSSDAVRAEAVGPGVVGRSRTPGQQGGAPSLPSRPVSAPSSAAPALSPASQATAESRADDQSGVSVHPRRRGAHGRLRVLVVDDDERFRNFAAAPFRSRDDDVRVASDGLEALSMCLEQPPDVILSDVQMPRMDGWQMLRLIRARPSLAGVPVIFLTSLSGDAERLMGYQLGVDAYMPKPYTQDELLLRVRQIVRRSRSSMGAPAARTTLRGELEHVGVPSLLTFVELERRTGVILVIGERLARLFFVDGRLRRVVIEGEPETASSWDSLVTLLGWTSGQFELSVQEVDCPDELQSSSTELLLEYARLVDEESQARIVESVREFESAKAAEDSRRPGGGGGQG